jgi:hypothetical protein
MQAVVSLPDHPRLRHRSHAPAALTTYAARTAWAGAAEPGPSELQYRYQHAVAAWVAAVDRAERAERRLRSRLVELTWPAALSALLGGVGAIVALRVAGY